MKKEPQGGRGKENWLKKRSWRNNAAGRKLHTPLNQLRVWQTSGNARTYRGPLL